MKKIFILYIFLFTAVLSVTSTTYAYASNTQMELTEVANYEFNHFDLTDFNKTGSWQSSSTGGFKPWFAID